MATHSFTIPLGSVDLDRLVTDDDYRREAQRLLPAALKQIGEKTGEVARNELEKGFRGIPGVTVNSSSSEKARFIREAAENHRSGASAQERRELEGYIIQQLRDMKQKAG